jgi:Ras-related protein Rap-1B
MAPAIFIMCVCANLRSLDTAGTDQFTAMRELYMKQGDGFLLVFSIANINSFYELSELREQIIRIKEDDDIPIVVVGNKCDMEEDRVVTRARAFQLAQQFGSKPYYETSARRRINVDEAFVNLSRQILQKDSNQYHRYDQPSATQRNTPPRTPGRPKQRFRHRDRCVIL